MHVESSAHSSSNPRVVKHNACHKQHTGLMIKTKRRIRTGVPMRIETAFNVVRLCPHCIFKPDLIRAYSSQYSFISGFKLIVTELSLVVASIMWRTCEDS